VGEQREPRWLREQRVAAEATRASAAASRKDAGKKHVIISEKYDHKAAAFSSAAVPYPFTSRDAFEGAMRVPLGRETNTDAAFRDMTRPKVLKQAGTTIAPIKFSRAPPQGGKGAAAGATKAAAGRGKGGKGGRN
jgi:U3 small nucleolar RNA-associated protein 14